MKRLHLLPTLFYFMRYRVYPSGTSWPKYYFRYRRDELIIGNPLARRRCPATLAGLHSSEHVKKGYATCIASFRRDPNNLVSRKLIHPDVLMAWDHFQEILLRADREERIVWRGNS